MSRVAGIIASRLLLGVLTLFAISLLVFFSVELLPGDVAQAILGQSATPEAVAALRHQLGLDLPAYVRYLDWLWHILHGDFGRSLANGLPIKTLVAERLGNTVFLALAAACIAMPIGVGLGIAATIYRRRTFDHAASMLSLVAISVPEFFSAYILMSVFAVGLGWLPAVSLVDPGQSLWQRLGVVALPAITLSLTVIAYVLRMTRASIINVMSAPYIEMAQLKGMSPWRVVVHHALPNALSPIINVVILNLAYLIVGVVVVEVVFV